MRLAFYFCRWFPAIVTHPRVAVLGWREGHGDMGITYDDPQSPRSTAYDVGRTLRRRDA